MPVSLLKRVSDHIPCGLSTIGKHRLSENIHGDTRRSCHLVASLETNVIVGSMCILDMLG